MKRKRKRKRKGNVGVDTTEGMACGERYNEFVAVEMMMALEGENKEDESIDLEGEKNDERVEEMVYADGLGSTAAATVMERRRRGRLKDDEGGVKLVDVRSKDGEGGVKLVGVHHFREQAGRW